MSGLDNMSSAAPLSEGIEVGAVSENGMNTNDDLADSNSVPQVDGTEPEPEEDGKDTNQTGKELWNKHRADLAEYAHFAGSTAEARNRFEKAGRRAFEHKWIARAAFQASTLGQCGALNLYCCKVGDDAVGKLARVLKSIKLVTINLTFNEIGDRGAGLLALGLQGNKTITELSLANNKVGDHGARLMAEVLADQGKLAVLNLSGNRIGDKGAKELSKYIEGNLVLEELCLDSNLIGVPGASTLTCNCSSRSIQPYLTYHHRLLLLLCRMGVTAFWNE
eukprot:SAG31_NODE_384_length_16414_cov_7.492308_16_plen_278_part_00